MQLEKRRDINRTPPAWVGGSRSLWQTFLAVGAVLGITQLSFYLTSAALPLYLKDLGAPQGRIGLEVGVGNATALAATLVLGPAINRYGAARFLRLGGLMYLVSAVGMLLVGQEVAVTVFRALQGVGAAFVMPAAFTLGTNLAPERKATAIGTLGVVNNIGLAVGPPVGLTLYGGSGATGLFLPAVLASVIGLLSTILIPAMPRPAERPRGFGFDPIWIPPLIGNLLLATYFGGILAYLPLDLRQLHGPNAGIFFTADAVGVLLLRVPTGLLADRRGSFWPKLLGLVFTVPGIIILTLHPSILTLVVSGAATGIGAGLFITGIMADLSNLSTPANRGTAMSLASASFSAGIFAGSAFSGLLIGPGGFNAVLLFGVITSLAAFPFALWRLQPMTSVHQT